MTKYRRLIPALVFFLVFSFQNAAQDIVINEVMSSNSSTLVDEDGENPDWLELYNRGGSGIDLEGFGISDDPEDRWVFPAITLAPGGHLLVYASDKDRANIPLHWETVLAEGDTLAYLVPAEEPPGDWTGLDFDDAAWATGASGFGYGDGDDATVLPNVLSVFIRTEFQVQDVEDVGGVVLDIDFDDAFVAYINGHEVARDNISSDGPPAYDQPADNYDHEAAMYQGGRPNRYQLGDISDLLTEGTNVLAIQVHNHTTGSSDLTAIPFLTIGHYTNGDYETNEALEFEHFGGLHTNFKISADGETLYLTNAAGAHIDSVEVIAMRPDISYGRAPDGAAHWGLFDETTPGEANGTEAFSGYSADVDFSHPGGIYQSAFQLTLSTAGGDAPIYYTLDGSAPDEEDTLYTDPIEISSTTVVRAAVYDPERLKGNIGSQSYLMNVSHGDLPIIALSTNPPNLWDEETGIHVMGPGAEENLPYYGANFWMDWEIPMNVQLIEPDGGGFSIDAGAKIFGAWSRANAQKSFALHFRNGYDGALSYQLFPEREMDTYHSMVLRNSGNDWNRALLRDGVIATLVHEDVDQQAFRQAVVYLNGEYWGILNMREKVNEDFLAAHHDLNPDDIEILEANAGVVEGNSDHFLELRDFIQANNLAEEENYSYVRTQMDVQNFIKYQVVNIFVDNTDWPGNNIKFWRESKEGSRWKWISYDREYSFNIYDGGNANNTLRFALEANGPGWPNPPWSTLFLRKLMTNPAFKVDFVNFFADELNSTYKSEKVINTIDYYASRIEDEVDSHFNKWGSSTGNWLYELDKMKNFASERPGYLWQYLAEEFSLSRHLLSLQNAQPDMGYIQVNTVEVEGGSWNGYYFGGVPVSITARPKPGYVFVGWEGDTTSTASQLEVDVNKSVSLTAKFEEASDEGFQIVVNEICYKPDSDMETEDWVELTNIGGSTADLSGWVLKDNNDENFYVLPENTALAPGQYLVLSRERDKFMAFYSINAPVIGDFGFGLSSDGDCVRLFDQTGELHDEVCYTSTSPWPTGGGGLIIGLFKADADNALGENWMLMTGGGTPGKANVETLLHSGDPAGLAVSFYPNPTREWGVLTFHQQSAGEVSIAVHDVSGRLVEEVYHGQLGQGDHRMVWDARHLMPGVYVLTIRDSDHSQVVRIIVK